MMRKLLLLGLLAPVLSFGQIFTEDFEGGTFPPAGWTLQQTNGNETWMFTSSLAINGSGSAVIDYDASLGLQDEWLISPSMDLTTVTTAFLSFNISMSYYWSVDPNDNYDVLAKISTDGGTSWTTVWTEEDQGVFATFEPFLVSVDISSYTGNPDVKIAIQYLGSDGAQAVVDDVAVTEEEMEEPPCTPTYFEVEAISNVTFADINNDSDPFDTDNSYEDFTDIVGSVTPGQSYPITVEGNTAGDFDTYVSAYIDWNQNGDFGDAGEYYEIGVISDSDGADGVQAAGTIAVPADAPDGASVMRIVKYYDEYAPGPCASEDEFAYGQTEDYTLMVGELSVASFDNSNFISYPNPMVNQFNLEYNKPMEEVTFYNLLGQIVQRNQVNNTVAAVDVSGLSAGTYIVKVVSDGAVKTIKVIKQ